jgi:hypothetical protein
MVSPVEPTEHQKRKKSPISTMLNWLGVVEKSGNETCPSPSDSSAGGDGNEFPCISESVEALSPNVQSVSDKVLTLKKSFEFESKLSERLEAIGSTSELLLFIQDALVFRFEQLHKIGLMNPESYQFIALLSDKMVRMTTSNEGNEKSGPHAMEELRRENAQLRQRIESIHTKYIKAGVITDEDLSKDREIVHLNARIRDQQTQMKIARKRLEALASCQEMIQTLRVRNGLLTSKTNQQASLLKSLTINNPQHEKLLGAVNKLSEENKQLKRDIERQSHLLSQLREHIPSDAQVVVDELLKQYSALREDLENKDGQLDAAHAADRDIHGLLDELQERNFQLKRTLETTQTIDRYIQQRAEGEQDFSVIVEALKSENERLQRSVTAKDEQIKCLTADPASRQLMAAYSRLQHDYRQIFKENQVKNQLYRQEVIQREGLMSQVRERTALIKENRQIKTELDAAKRLAQSYKRSEQQLIQIKKANAELENKYQRTAVEFEEARKKLSRVTAEYKLLMKEYENIFGKQ